MGFVFGRNQDFELSIGLTIYKEKRFYFFLENQIINFSKKSGLLTFDSVFSYNIPIKFHKILRASDFQKLASALERLRRLQHHQIRYTTQINLNLP